MFDKIRSDNNINRFIKDECCDNNIAVTFDPKIEKDSILIIKVDDYYNSLGLSKPPPSPDCLIITKCINGGYSLHIVELKNITSAKGFNVDNLIQKYVTCLDDFVTSRFSKYFLKDYKVVKLYFVSRIDVYGRDIGLKLEILINYKIKFNGKNYLIRPDMPSPSIKPCY